MTAPQYSHAMTTSTPPTKTAVIFAGEIFDGSDAAHPLIVDLEGREFTVRARAMPARHLGRVLQLCTDEAALLEFVCLVRAESDPSTLNSQLSTSPNSQLSGWQPADAAFVDNLADASHVLLMEAAKRLNFSRAATWGHRQIEAGQMKTGLMLKTDEMLSPVVEKMAHLLISSLKLSESPAKPTTKS